MTRRERKAALMIRGLTQEDIAIALGVSRGMVGMVLTRKSRSRGLKIERYIAEQLGRSVDDVFPADEIIAAAAAA